jgi:hypothetical protein
MTDPRLGPVIEVLRSCTGTCTDSRAPHVHFPDGWEAFLEAASAAMEEPAQPTPDPIDPLDDLMARWQRAFAVVWDAMKPEGDIAKAADIALVMARGSPIG